MRHTKVLVAGALVLAAGAGFALAPRHAAVEVAATASTEAKAFAVDAVHSVVIFRVSHNEVGTFYGRFNEISGSFLLDEANPSGGMLDFTVNLPSVDTANQKRDDHLRSPDFFNTALNKTATFKSKSIASDGDGFKVEGDFTMMGVTKPVTVKVTSAGMKTGNRGELAGFDAKFSLKRSDFGMTKFAEGIGNDVVVMVGVEGTR